MSPYQEVLSTDTPNQGRTKWNANNSELYSRAGVVMSINDAALQTWTDMPAALTEFRGLAAWRTRINLAGYSEARITARVGVAGSANAELRVQYSTDEVTWNYLDGASGPLVNVSAVATRVGAWVPLSAGAKADVFLRVVGINGDGLADPQFGLVQVQAR